MLRTVSSPAPSLSAIYGYDRGVCVCVCLCVCVLVCVCVCVISCLNDNYYGYIHYELFIGSCVCVCVCVLVPHLC